MYPYESAFPNISAVFAGNMVLTNTQANHATCNICSNSPHLAVVLVMPAKYLAVFAKHIQQLDAIDSSMHQTNCGNLQAHKVQTGVEVTSTYTTMKDVRTIQTLKQLQKNKTN